MHVMSANGLDHLVDGKGGEQFRTPSGSLRMLAARRAFLSVALSGGMLLPLAACETAGPTAVGQPVTGATSSAAAAGTAGGMSPASSSSNEGGGTPRCQSGDLSAKYLGGNGHHGSATKFYALSNTSSHDCSLSGVPEVRAVDSKGKTLATAEPQSGPEKKVTLHPGGKAYTSLDVGLGGLDGNADKAPCNPPATALWLIPPGETAHVVLDGRSSVCNGHFVVTPFDSEYPDGIA